jgi:hypothetical protein
MVLDLAVDRAIPRIGAGRDLRFLGAPHPPDRVVIGTSAARALEACGALFRFFGEELTFVHVRSVHHVLLID